MWSGIEGTRQPLPPPLGKRDKSIKMARKRAPAPNFNCDDARAGTALRLRLLCCPGQRLGCGTPICSTLGFNVDVLASLSVATRPAKLGLLNVTFPLHLPLSVRVNMGVPLTVAVPLLMITGIGNPISSSPSIQLPFSDLVLHLASAAPHARRKYCRRQNQFLHVVLHCD